MDRHLKKYLDIKSMFCNTFDKKVYLLDLKIPLRIFRNISYFSVNV